MLLKKLNDGNEIPMIGMGTWQQTEKDNCINAIKYALKVGYRHIDTADIYGNHTLVKDAIKGFSREKLFITTKLWRDFLDPKLVESQCDKALMELDLDYLDLYLVHWPDRTKPLAEISYEMSKLKEKGKVKSIGVCNYTINHLQELINQGIKIAINQVEYHPFLNQESLLTFCNRHSISLIAYSPIARGQVFQDPDILQLSKKYSKTPGQVTLKWMIQKDIVVIPKATSEKHIKDNFEIFDFEISLDDMKKIDEIHKIRPQRLINPEFSDFVY
ncbi:MAG: 2,5-diketo-D-gluconic acid reductase A [Candidatus Anoxychlamydiales bacterium]|nr:2,5-diketo-D-gluconic acid reductase A [Candidatus Anoxychlamydiales bacterium]